MADETLSTAPGEPGITNVPPKPNSIATAGLALNQHGARLIGARLDVDLHRTGAPGEEQPANDR